MKCINKITWIISLFLLVLLAGCGSVGYDMPYDPNYPVSSFCVTNYKTVQKSNSFASNLCVTSQDILGDDNLLFDDIGSAGLFDMSSSQVLYSYNIHSRMSPASLTKVLTALTALKYGSLDQMLTATENSVIDDPYAQTFGLKSGDQMTLDQALHILLINSANDVALMIAENLGGTVEAFVDLMNQEAKAIGATNTHFMNPHGLTEDNHYTSAYDLYLMFNEACKYDEFRQIIAMDSYTTRYRNANSQELESTVKATNQYMTKNYTAPSNITVLGGKTGTTNAAGNCLIILTKDTSGKQYISIIMRAKERQFLYTDMNRLLSEIH